jgi:hypothetical protein
MLLGLSSKMLESAAMDFILHRAEMLNAANLNRDAIENPCKPPAFPLFSPCRMASKSSGSSCGRPIRGAQSSTAGSTACKSDSTCSGCSRHSSVAPRYPTDDRVEPFSTDSTSISRAKRLSSSPSYECGASNASGNPAKVNGQMPLLPSELSCNLR